jgi:hypothetical protein
VKGFQDQIIRVSEPWSFAFAVKSEEDLLRWMDVARHGWLERVD